MSDTGGSGDTGEKDSTGGNDLTGEKGSTGRMGETSRMQDGDARLHESTLEQRIVYEGRFLKLRQDLASLPDGSTGTREFVLHPGASAMVPLADDGRILIERQFRYPMGRVYLEIPAGKHDPGESPLQTARRELLEETGYEAREWALLTAIHPAIGFSNEIIHIYLARALVQKRQALDHGEFLELEWMTLGALVDELRAGRIPDVKTQIAVHWLQRMTDGDWPWPEFERG